MDLFPTGDFQFVVKQGGRRGINQSAPIEATSHDLVEKGAALTQILPRRCTCRELRRRGLGIFPGGATGNNLSACHELIAERVIAVGMSVD
jgi:hypothetical protein